VGDPLRTSPGSGTFYIGALSTLRIGRRWASKREANDEDEPSILSCVGQADAVIPLDQFCLCRCPGRHWYRHPLR
jgi:hypothetical protein